MNRTNSKSNLSLAASGGTPQATPRGGNLSSELQYLTILCGVLNNDKEQIGLDPLKTWKVRDIDKLSSEDMLKIVVHILYVVNMKNQKLTNVVPLQGSHSLGGLYYDSAIDQIYHKVRILFPENSDLFHYSVLLMPSYDIKRTRAVLIYLLQFFLFSNNLLEDYLKPCHQIILEECREMVAVSNEIADLQNKIADATHEKEKNLLGLPELQANITKIEEINNELKSLLFQKETILKQQAEKYQAKEQKIDGLKQNLQELTLATECAEMERVENPQLLVREAETLKKQYAAETAEREKQETYRLKVNNECADLERVSAMLKSMLADLTEHNEKLQNLIELEKALNPPTKGKESRAKKLKRKKKETADLKQHHTLTISHLEKMKAQQTKEIEKLQTDIERAKREFQPAKQSRVQMDEKLKKIEAKIPKIKEQIEDLEKKIDENKKALYEQLPKKYESLNAERERLLERVRKEITNKYPALPGIEPKNKDK